MAGSISAGAYTAGVLDYLFETLEKWQEEKDKINAGDKGNAHSEYIGPLAESGLVGGITFLAIIITTLYTAVRVIRDTRNDNHRYLLLAATLGMVTYYIHGALNNFLDTDKASIPFWGFTAFIVASDLLLQQKKSAQTSE